MISKDEMADFRHFLSIRYAELQEWC